MSLSEPVFECAGRLSTGSIVRPRRDQPQSVHPAQFVLVLVSVPLYLTLMFEVTAWNNGGNGYGFRVSKAGRDRYFSKTEKQIKLRLSPGDTPLLINIKKPSFWKSCPELIHVGIRDWLIANGFDDWPHRKPPKFMLEKISDTEFQLKFQSS